MNNKLKAALSLVAAAVLSACATSPSGRSQLMMISDDKMDAMGVESFDQMKKEMKISSDQTLTRHVQCVARKIIATLPEENREKDWEVVLFDSDQVNAFALPGNKIGVYTGLLNVAADQSQLAAVLGHEVGHVLAHHSNERASTQVLTSSAIQIGTQLSGQDEATQKTIAGVLGMGANVGILLPFSRTHESEADLIGLKLMANAGFDPRQSVKLWENMGAAGGKQPPELLSTHPAHATRIKRLQENMQTPLAHYNVVKADGQAAHCY